MYQKEAVIKMDEYAPQITPTIRGIANSLTEATPKMQREASIMNVVIFVLIERCNVYVTHSFSIL
jgi:hypothetical protein